MICSINVHPLHIVSPLSGSWFFAPQVQMSPEGRLPGSGGGRQLWLLRGVQAQSWAAV
jgi:hypothetical protein